MQPDRSRGATPVVVIMITGLRRFTRKPGSRVKRQNVRWSVATRIFATQLIAVFLLSGCLTLMLWLVLRQSANDTAARLSLGVSTTLAHDPFVLSRLRDPDPTGALEPYALDLVRTAGVDFVTIMSPAGIRYTHPALSRIGGKFLGNTSAALAGRSITETYTGTLGSSVRAVVPVIEDGRVVALVSAGVTVEKVLASLASRIPLVIGAAIVIVLIGTVGAFFARRFLARITGSMRPSELAQMVEYYESVLHSVREGLILTDSRGRVVLYNDEAADLLDLPPISSSELPATVLELGLPPSIAALIEGRERVVEQSHVSGSRILLINQEAASPTGGARGHPLGSLTTLRDRTEVQRLSGELESVRTLSDVLRSQTHEYANRLHTVVSLLELGRPRDAIELIAQQTELSQRFADELVGASGESTLGALLLGKVAQANERGVQLRLSVQDELETSALLAIELVSVVGNLVDNALDAAVTGSAQPRVTLRIVTDRTRGMITLTVSDNGTGIAPEVARSLFVRGVSTKPTNGVGRGFGLAVVKDILDLHGGRITVCDSGPNGTTFEASWPLATTIIGEH